VPYALHVRFRPWRQGYKEFVTRFSVAESSASLTRRLDNYFRHLAQVVQSISSQAEDVPAKKTQIRPSTAIEEPSWYDLPF
jgi:phenylpropionate dioxygenase-like ring-hydroxylating dioxygenase large terminal subunit